MTTGSALAAVIAQEGLELGHVDVMCSSSAAGPEASSTTKYEVALSVCSGTQRHSREVLALLAKMLAPGARLYMQDAAGSQVSFNVLEQ